jgi:ABC-type phosphate transport system substrate-binding protein
MPFLLIPNIGLWSFHDGWHQMRRNILPTLGLPAREVKIAIDAIAFVINLQNTDTMLRYDQVMDILSGKISMWSQLDPTSKLGEIIVVFDNQRSSTVRYISETVLEGKALAHNSFCSGFK